MITIREFLNNVWEGQYSPLDIKNILREITNGFEDDALKSIELELYHLEENKLEEYANKNLDLDYSLEFKDFSLYLWMYKNDEEITKKRQELYFNAFQSHYMRMYNFRKTLHSFLDDSSISEETKNIQPIHWLKGEKPLRLFVDELKSAGLIEKRQTEDIIQEHFRKTNQTPQPIKWTNTNRLLIYLINKLSESDLIDTLDRQFRLITEHFLDKKGQPFKGDSLKQDSYNLKYNSDPKGSNIIDNIISKLTD